MRGPRLPRSTWPPEVALVAAFLLVLVMLPTLAATARSLPELGASASPAASPAQAIAGPWILVGAGDIATGPPGASGPDERTAQLIDKIVSDNPGRVTVFTAGDNAYEDGTPGDYRHYFDPTWGRHKAIMRPVPGNHEYQSEDAAGYFAYFGHGAGDGETGYYAYDLGSWRVYALNSEIEVSAGMFQEQWLREDLAAHAETRCVAAYWHRPRFSRGPHGSAEDIRPLWQALYDFNAELWSSRATTTTTSASRQCPPTVRSTPVEGSGSGWWGQGVVSSTPSTARLQTRRPGTAARTGS